MPDTEFPTPRQMPLHPRKTGDTASLRHTVADDAPPAVPPLPAAGTTVGSYIIAGVLGEGGYGVVFRGVHRLMNRTVAIKMPRPAADRSLYDAIADLRREADMLAALDSPHFVRVMDFRDTPPGPMLVLEYVRGVTLEDLIRQAGGLRVGPAVRLLSQLANAMLVAHAAGVVHNDLKPANVLVTNTGGVKLADLGLADRVGSTTPRTAGTRTHIAPELVTDSRPGTPATDVYAFGVTVYQTVTGKLPFDAPDPDELLALHTTFTPLPPHRLRPEVPRWLSGLVMRALAKEPHDRPTFAEIKFELAARHHPAC